MGKPNTKYFVNARSALYTPAPKDSDKPGTLRLEGVVPTVLGEVRSGDDVLIGRVTAAQLFGGPKAKQRLPVFDKKEGGMDVVLMGKKKFTTLHGASLARPRGAAAEPSRRCRRVFFFNLFLIFLKSNPK